MADVRDHVEYILTHVADEAAAMVGVATALLSRVNHLPKCARAELLATRGAAYRESGSIDKCADDLDSAAKARNCQSCKPRILRQRAMLATCQGNHEQARESIDSAISICALSGPFELIPHLHLTRCALLHLAGDHVEALASARLAQSGIRRRDGYWFLVLVLRLAICLMASPVPANWHEAWKILHHKSLKAISGGVAVKLCLRWGRALVGVEIGLISLESARYRIRLVCDELQAIGSPNAVAAVSDSALLGCSKVSKAAAKAMGIFTDAEGAEDVRQALADLRDASAQGDDVHALALRVRELCPGAPPIPPSLKKAA